MNLTNVKIAAALLVAALALAGVHHWQTVYALRARLLRFDPDQIDRDAELFDYARPRGEASFRVHCSVCHGAQLRGDPARGVPDLADADWLYGTGRTGEIERVVLYGIRAGRSKTLNLASMPAFGTANPYARYKIEPLRPDEVEDLTALVYAFQHPSAVDPETVRRGSVLYHGKGLCFDCHADHATGDPAIGAPNLTDATWLYGSGSRESIRQSITMGLGGVCPAWIGRLDPGEIRSVAVYVHAQRATRGAGP